MQNPRSRLKKNANHDHDIGPLARNWVRHKSSSSLCSKHLQYIGFPRYTARGILDHPTIYENPHGMRPAFVAAPIRMSMESSKLYATRSVDKPGHTAVRTANRAAHFQWVSDQVEVYSFAGPMRTAADAPITGSLLIMRENDMESVQKRLQTDPYVGADLFESVETRQWVCGMKSETPLPTGLFSVWCVDKAGMKELRKETRSKHLDWWKESGRVGWIGPFPAEDGDGYVGTLILCAGESLEEVQQWAATDPYNQADLFESVHVNLVTRVVEDGKMLLSL